MMAMFQRNVRKVYGLILVVLFLAGGETASRGQWLATDNFDVGNGNSNPPKNWTLSAPAGTSITVLDAFNSVPFSGGFCVRMLDNSASNRPQMSQTFPPTDAGIASAYFKLPVATNGPCSLQL